MAEFGLHLDSLTLHTSEWVWLWEVQVSLMTTFFLTAFDETFKSCTLLLLEWFGYPTSTNHRCFIMYYNLFIYYTFLWCSFFWFVILWKHDQLCKFPCLWSDTSASNSFVLSIYYFCASLESRWIIPPFLTNFSQLCGRLLLEFLPALKANLI